MNKLIPYGKQKISNEDIKSVSKVLRSEYLTQGPNVIKFEKKIGVFCDSKYVVAVNSATSALHLSCLALDLKSNFMDLSHFFCCIIKLCNSLWGKSRFC